MVRRKNSWSKTQYETSYGGVQLNPDDQDELAAELGHGEVHDNDLWSDLDALKNRVDAKAKSYLDDQEPPTKMPANIEPGFESQYNLRR